MSDYLGNLVMRTLSQAAIVRPHLPSLFEPSVASGQISSELEFQRQTFSASPPTTRREEAIAANLPSILTPRESSLGDLEPTPIAHHAETAGRNPPSVLTAPQSMLGEPPQTPIMHRAGTSASSAPSILAESQPVSGESQPTLTTDDPGTRATLGQSLWREPESIISRPSRPKGIFSATEDPELSPEDAVPRPVGKWRESRSVPVRGETSVEPATPELRKSDSRTGQFDSSSRGSRGSEAPPSISQLSTPDSQPNSPSLVRPAVTAQKIHAVQAVVPAIRALPQFPSTSTPVPSSTINVTIGRLEIRAAPPAAPPRARPKAANVLSLEAYLRQRAKGGGR